MRLIFFITLIYFTSSPAISKDFGHMGNSYDIAEQDILAYIQEKLTKMGEATLLAHQKKISDKIVKQIKRPKPVAGITRALEDNIRLFDPSIIVEEDIRDAHGFIIHKAGTRINPLKYDSFNEQWVIIDGDDEEQEAFAIELLKSNEEKGKLTKIILIKGEPGSKEEGLFYFFDQFGEISKKLNITKVPSIVRQADNQDLIEIKEVSLND